MYARGNKRRGSQSKVKAQTEAEPQMLKNLYSQDALSKRKSLLQKAKWLVAISGNSGAYE
jgi:hypothetical protein